MATAPRSSQADGYKWTDKEGTLHFSDTPPAGGVSKEGLDLTDPSQRPLLAKPLLVYRDKIFTLTLTGESDDLLEFELTYSDIHRAFPEIVSRTARLQVSATTGERFYTYLSYSVAAVDGGSKTVRLTNRMSKQSRQELETEALRISLYDYLPEQKRFHELFSKEIPFGKSWHKLPGVKYQ